MGMLILINMALAMDGGRKTPPGMTKIRTPSRNHAGPKVSREIGSPSQRWRDLIHSTENVEGQVASIDLASIQDFPFGKPGPQVQTRAFNIGNIKLPHVTADMKESQETRSVGTPGSYASATPAGAANLSFQKADSRTPTYASGKSAGA